MTMEEAMNSQETREYVSCLDKKLGQRILSYMIRLKHRNEMQENLRFIVSESHERVWRKKDVKKWMVDNGYTEKEVANTSEK